MRNSFCFIFIIFSFVLTQCDNLSEVNCVDNENCDWISDVVNMNCSSLSNQTSCENYSNYGCDWTWSWGGWMNSGSSCTGGTFQIDYGYCEEIIMPECSEMNQFECGNSNYCNWVVDVSYGNCGSLTVAECYDYPGQCYVDSEPGWYDSSGPYCTGGTYQIDDSYCEEAFMQGDLNFDNIINIQDIIGIISFILNGEYNNLADMNSDGVINVIDALYIVDIILNN